MSVSCQRSVEGPTQKTSSTPGAIRSGSGSELSGTLPSFRTDCQPLSYATLQRWVSVHFQKTSTWYVAAASAVGGDPIGSGLRFSAPDQRPLTENSCQRPWSVPSQKKSITPGATQTGAGSEPSGPPPSEAPGATLL